MPQNNKQPKSLAEIHDEEYRHVSNEDLLKKIRDGLSFISRALVDIAIWVGVASRRGIDLSIVRDPGLIDLLHKIENGQIDPQLAEKYMHGPVRLFNCLKRLTLDDQKAIVESGTVLVVLRRNDGFTNRKIEVTALTQRQQKQVFKKDRIRTEQEQIAFLDDQEPATADPYDESIVSFNFKLENLELPKSKKREFDKLMKEKPGEVSRRIREAILKLL